VTNVRANETGLRELKKRRTREAISAAAWRLFAERGFDTVPIAQIATEARVSESTVFNYFSTKENLVYGCVHAFEDDLLEAVRDRAPGTSILAAFGAFVIRPRGLLDSSSEQNTASLATITQVITGSETLLSRERQLLDGYTIALARLIEGEARTPPGHIDSWVVANALMGVHRALLEHVRRRIRAGADEHDVAREVRAHGKRALTQLAHGLYDIGL
jgi:AcrR family transcriptional regulator